MEWGQPTNGSAARRHSSQSHGFAVRLWSNLCICSPAVVQLVRTNLAPDFPLFHDCLHVWIECIEMRHSVDLGFRVWPFLVWDSVVNTILLWQWHVSVQHISWQTTLKKTCQSSLLQQCKCIFENESWYFHADWGCWHWLQQWQILASVYIFDKRGCCLSSSDTDHDTFRDLMHTGSSQHVPMKGYLIQTSDVLGQLAKLHFPFMYQNESYSYSYLKITSLILILTQTDFQCNAHCCSCSRLSGKIAMLAEEPRNCRITHSSRWTGGRSARPGGTGRGAWSRPPSGKLCKHWNYSLNMQLLTFASTTPSQPN